MYFIGIDIGIHETVVARTPGYNGEPISVIPLELNNGIRTTVLKTALCKNNETYSLLSKKEFNTLKLGDDDKTSTLLEGFIKATEDMTTIDKESMIVFTKLLLQTIIESDDELNGNNYIIGITCRHCFTNLSYVDFLRDECKLYRCVFIDDVYATKYMQHKSYDNSKNVLVIDIGTTAADFKVYIDSEFCYKNSCNINYGFNKIYDALKPKVICYGDNKRNLQYLINLANGPSKHVIETNFTSYIEEKIQLYYQYRIEDFELNIRYAELFPDWNGAESDTCIKFNISKDELDILTANYKSGLCDILTNIYTKLALANSMPDKVMLIGKYSNMAFIRSSISDIFKLPICEHYNMKYEVAMGIAFYVNDTNRAKENLKAVIQNKIENFSVYHLQNENNMLGLCKLIAKCINDELGTFNVCCQIDENDVAMPIVKACVHSYSMFSDYEANTRLRRNIASTAIEILESCLPHAFYSPELRYRRYRL